MNPFDANALEESLRLKDRYGFRVAVISMGPPNAAFTLRKALAVGADSGVLLSDRAFGGADTLATSMVLAAAVKKLGDTDEVVMVVCGKQTIDGDTAQVGPGIATRLGYTQLTLVDQVQEVNLAARTIKVRRKLEGHHEVVQAPLPVLLSVVREINQPRYPTVPRRLASELAEITLWDNKSLQLDEQTIGLKGSATQVRRIFSPERAKGEILGDGENGPGQAARLLIDTLLAKDILSFRQ
jgi:electron transfer flavoprotein beta subunit